MGRAGAGWEAMVGGDRVGGNGGRGWGRVGGSGGQGWGRVGGSGGRGQGGWLWVGLGRATNMSRWSYVACIGNNCLDKRTECDEV